MDEYLYCMSCGQAHKLTASPVLSSPKDNEKLRDLIAFVQDIATNYDCDADGHKYGTYCRRCEAARILKDLGE